MSEPPRPLLQYLYNNYSRKSITRRGSIIQDGKTSVVKDKINITWGVTGGGEQLGELGVVLHAVQDQVLQEAPMGQGGEATAAVRQGDIGGDRLTGERLQVELPGVVLALESGTQRSQVGEIGDRGACRGRRASGERQVPEVVGAKQVVEEVVHRPVPVAGVTEILHCCAQRSAIQKLAGGMPGVGEEGEVLGFHVFFLMWQMYN